MKKSKILIIVMVILLLSSCSSNQSNTTEVNATLEEENTDAPVPTEEPTAEPTAEPTPEPTEEPENLKYIFYIIGDGMGEAHMALNEIATRVMNEDMNSRTIMEDLDYYHTVTAGRNSARGGTALACGYQKNHSPISTDNGGNDLVTILDRAKENGFATGVVTDSYISDATPATFTTHAKDRMQIDEIAKEIVKTDVDFLGGGGIGYIISEEMSDYTGEQDCNYQDCRYAGNKYLGENLVKTFPNLIIGESTRDEILAMEQSGVYPDRLAIVASNIQLLCQGDTGLEKNYDVIDKSVDLADIARTGIGVLEQNENGFVYMIEAGILDKVCHNQAVPWIAEEMLNMEEMMEVVMEFYYEHPKETLIVITADHETGDFRDYTDEAYEQFYDFPQFVIQDSAESTNKFLEENWGVRVDDARMEKAYKVYADSPYTEDIDNIGPLAGEIAAVTLESLGIYTHAGEHSYMEVPLITHGVMADQFQDVEAIEGIPIRMCELMGWAQLPAIVK